MSDFTAFRRAAADGQIARAIDDVRETAARWRLWLLLGWLDVRQRYRRSLLGPLWLTLSMAAMVAGIGILYAGLFGQDVGEYMPFLAVGLIFWNFMAGLINDGCTVFIAAEHTIKQMRMPFTLHVFRQIWRNVIMLGHNLLIYVAIVLIFQIPVGWSLLLVVPGLALLLVNGWSAGVVFGIIAARFRDVPPIIGSIVQIAFFLTPIIWRPESLPDRAAFLKLNPFYYLLEIVRQPLLGSVPSLEIWLGALAFTTVGFVTAAVMFYRYRRRIAYWV